METDTLKIIPLGGMGNVTKNMFAYETRDEILLVDCGIGFPEAAMLGVDLLIPDSSYLEDKQDKIVGMLLTHGHDDHIAALPYIVPKLKPFPIYGSPLTIAFANDRCKDFDVKLETHEIKGEFQLASFTILPIRVTHSIPDARHFAITTPAGVIYHGSDFKLDTHPIDGLASETQLMETIGNRGVKLLLLDSLRAERDGWSLSESLLTETFEREIKSVKGKFVVTVMSSNIHRIQQAITVAASHGRTIAFLGRSVEQNVRTAQALGMLKLPKNVINKRKINHVDPEKLCVIISGSQGQEGSSLTRASVNEHDLITITPEDKVVFSTEPIPGNETQVYQAIDNIARLGATVAYSDVDDTMHVSGHASRDELEKVISLIKPEYIVPIGGAYRHMIQFRQLAIGKGYAKEQVFVLDSGETIELTPESVHLGPKVELKDIMVDGLGVGDVGSIVLSDRRQMAESGIVVILILVTKSGSLLGNPEVISRGFVYMKHAKKLVKKIQHEVKQVLPTTIHPKNWTNSVKPAVEQAVANVIETEVERHPLILPVVRRV